MSLLVALLAQLIHIALMGLAAPTVAGMMVWLEARLSGRGGPPVLLPWHDLLRLSRKTMAIPESASPVLSLAPAISLGATATAAALIPSFTLGMTLAPLADTIAITGLLSLAHAARCVGALDTGSPASGVAVQQASALAVLAEPALLLFVFALALLAGSFNLDAIIGQQREGMLLPAAASALALTSLLALVFADFGATASGFDADLSGIDLAIARCSGWLRRIIWIDLIGGLFLPIGMAGPESGLADWGVGLACWAVKLVAAVLCLSGVGTLLGHVAKRDRPDLVGLAALVALLTVIVVLASAGTT